MAACSLVAFAILRHSCVFIPAANRQGGDIVSTSFVRTYVCVCVCVTITRKILERSVPIFVGSLGTLGQQALGSVALGYWGYKRSVGWDVQRQGIRALGALVFWHCRCHAGPELRSTRNAAKCLSSLYWGSCGAFRPSVKPGFHSNAIACVHATNASASQ